MAVTIKARLTYKGKGAMRPMGDCDGDLPIAQFPGETAGGYFNHVYRLNKVLQNMSNRGIPISEEKLDQMAVDLANEREKLLLQVQELIKVRGEGKEKLFSYGEKDFYLTLPKVLRQWCKDKGEVRIEDKRRKNKETGKMEMTKVEVEYPFNPFLNEMKYGTASLKEVDKEFYDYSIEEGFEWVERHEGSTLVARIVAGKQFNPESPQQVMMYCKWMSYEIPTAMKKTSLGKEEKETTDDAALEELWKKTKDPMFQLIQEIRGNNKLAKTYVSGWRSNRADGRLHSTYTFRPATGQLSSTAPNVQNPHPIIKTAVVATAGRVLVECDYSGYHAQLLGYFAGDREYMKLATLGLHDYLAAHILRSKISNMKATEFNSNKQLWLETSQHLSTLDSWLSLPDTELGEKLHWIKKNHKEVRNKQAKPCIAEGELVLTDRGLVPIQNVRLADRVWDGVEWVSHDGVEYKGIKEVIKYEGLWATPDHEVFTRQEGKIQFQEASRRKIPIERTGIGGKAIRTGDNYFLQNNSNQGIHLSKSSMYGMLRKEMDQQRQLTKGKNWRMSKLWADYMSLLGYVRESLGQYGKEVQEALRSSLQVLWRSWDRTAVCFAEGVYPVDLGESPPQWISGSGNRSNRQQWTLRAGELEAGIEEGEYGQPEKYSESILSGKDDFAGRFQQSLWAGLDEKVGKQGAYRRTDNSTISLQQVKPKRLAKVYDIVNAGPRRRFTVSGLLVQNCVHGLGFGMGVKKLYDMNKGSFASLKEAESIRNIMVKLFPKVFKFQAMIVEKAHKEKKLVSPYGFVRRFWEAKIWRNGQMVNGEDAEKIIAFLPANTAFSIKKEAMLRLEEKGANYKYRLVNEVHDSLVYEVDEGDLEEMMEVVTREMTRPVMRLANEMFPEGFIPVVEVKVGKSWDKMEVVG